MWVEVITKIIDKLELKRSLGAALLGLLFLFYADDKTQLSEWLASEFDLSSGSWMAWFVYSGCAFFVLIWGLNIYMRIQKQNRLKKSKIENRMMAIEKINDLSVDTQLVLLRYMKTNNSFIKNSNYDLGIETLKQINWLVERPIKDVSMNNDSINRFVMTPARKYKLKDSQYYWLRKLYDEGKILTEF